MHTELLFRMMKNYWRGCILVYVHTHTYIDTHIHIFLTTNFEKYRERDGRRWYMEWFLKTNIHNYYQLFCVCFVPGIMLRTFCTASHFARQIN